MSTSRPAPNEDRLPTAGWGRRILALLIDWVASTLVYVAIVGPHRYSRVGGGVPVFLVFFVEVVPFTVLAGASFGQLAVRLRVERVGGGRLPIWDVLVRTALICLVIPPLVFRPDGRGLHDMAVGSYVRPLNA